MSGLPVPPGDANVPKPSGTPGDITVLNWAGFKAAVSYTFDDANTSQIQNWDKLKALGVPFTFFLWTGKQEAGNSVWQDALMNGHELGNHTQSHQMAGSGPDADQATQFIKDKFGVQPWTMAAPYGDGSWTNVASTRFLINRGVSNAVIAPNSNTNPFSLPTYIPPTNAGESQFNAEVDSARSAGGWRTMCIHGFTGGNDGAYQPVSLDGFIKHVEYVKSLGDVWIGSLVDVGAYWRGQKAFSQAMTTTMGTEKKWTWTLPDNFPPGKYLRIKVDGGTVKQKGVEVPWDSHGYYEIALDAGEVTVSP